MNAEEGKTEAEELVEEVQEELIEENVGPEDEIVEGEVIEIEEEAEEPETSEVEDASQARIAELEEELAEAQAEAQKNLDGWQRAQATFENYRRRIETEKAEWRANATADILVRVLDVLDDFSRAFDNLPEDLEEHPWLGGVRLVRQKLHRLLEVEGVKAIEAEPGQLFDPYYHEAVLTMETDEYEEDHVVSVTQQGYLQGERVLRPAKVVIAKAPKAPEPPPVPEAEEGSAEDETDEA
jgi:molecular chaperone GrpE